MNSWSLDDSDSDFDAALAKIELPSKSQIDTNKNCSRGNSNGIIAPFNINQQNSFKHQQNGISSANNQNRFSSFSFRPQSNSNPVSLPITRATVGQSHIDNSHFTNESLISRFQKEKKISRACEIISIVIKREIEQQEKFLREGIRSNSIKIKITDGSSSSQI